MVNWTSIQELTLEAAVFTKFMHSLLGLYAWEFVISLNFEWDLLTGKKRFRWPLIFYFAGRYSLLVALIGIAIALDTTHEINCEALYTFNQITGNAAVGLASINLSFRTMAIWSQNRYIIGLLVVLILGHWSLILQGVLLKAEWSPTAGGCVITHTSNTVLAATFIYSMAFDLLVLLLNAYRLISTGLAPTPIRGSSKSAAINSNSTGSRLGRLIFHDGLIFFFIAFLSNLLATVFMVLNLNQIMSVIFNVPAAVASTIVASRAVRRLTNFTNQGPEVFNASATGVPMHTHGAVSMAGIHYHPTNHRNSGLHTKSRSQPGVHVQMETFTKTEDTSPNSGSDKDNASLGSGSGHGTGTVVVTLNGDLEKGVAISGWE